ncbi:hypothetical protein HPB47_027445 [Ixodes persulcatus]|uniref:Uncharacterized protein n=1 Tax=Ixodes persulcatus TaxID=34615 RepID=A0AC60PW13_IXOPE|nr:hypothetical protein HPB47_027445 [Ixodes persulcatus]
MLREFGENLSKTLNETLSAKFEAMLAQFTESMCVRIASLNARVTSSENATPRQKPTVTTLVRRNLPAIRRNTGVSALSAAHREGLTLITDPTHPTRIGNSVSGDTTPDFTFTKNTRKEASWLNTQENLGSDHYLVAIVVESGIAKRTSDKRIQLIDLDTFRELQAAERPPSLHGTGQRLLDRPITVSEVRGAILALRTRSAPGADGITNKMLRNLDNN